MGGMPVYVASHIKQKRSRATQEEMKERAKFLIRYAEEHGPVSVRQLYYQAEVAGLAGIDKTESGYNKVQRQVLKLRRDGLLDYTLIADSTRWMRKPRSHNSVRDALEQTARQYRRALWHDIDEYVEIWCEKNALASVLMPVTSEYDVPLMTTNGYCSETFAFESVAQRDGDDRPYYVYYLGDFDRSGVDAARALKRKLTGFAGDDGIEVIFEEIAVNQDQITGWRLPTREPKRKSKADKRWPHNFACELDAIPPDTLRDLVRKAINRHLPEHQLKALKVAEDSERLDALIALGEKFKGDA